MRFNNILVQILLIGLLSINASICSMDSKIEKLRKEARLLMANENKSDEEARKIINDLMSGPEKEKAYKKIAMIVHPDKTNGNPNLQELFKYVGSINDQSKPQVTTGQNSKLVKAINKKIKSENQLSQIKTCNDHYFKLISIATAKQAQQAYAQFFIEKNIHNAFSILFSSFVPEYTENSPWQQELKKREEHLEDIQEMQEQLKDDIKMQKKYTKSLHEAQKEIDNATKQKLEKMLKKGKK